MIILNLSMNNNDLIKVINMYILPKFKGLGECYDITIKSLNRRNGRKSVFKFRSKNNDYLSSFIQRREVEFKLEELFLLMNNLEHRGNLILVEYCDGE